MNNEIENSDLSTHERGRGHEEPPLYPLPKEERKIYRDKSVSSHNMPLQSKPKQMMGRNQNQIPQHSSDSSNISKLKYLGYLNPRKRDEIDHYSTTEGLNLGEGSRNPMDYARYDEKLRKEINDMERRAYNLGVDAENTSISQLSSEMEIDADSFVKMTERIQPEIVVNGENESREREDVEKHKDKLSGIEKEIAILRTHREWVEGKTSPGLVGIGTSGHKKYSQGNIIDFNQTTDNATGVIGAHRRPSEPIRGASDRAGPGRISRAKDSMSPYLQTPTITAQNSHPNLTTRQSPITDTTPYTQIPIKQWHIISEMLIANQYGNIPLVKYDTNLFPDLFRLSHIIIEILKEKNHYQRMYEEKNQENFELETLKRHLEHLDAHNYELNTKVKTLTQKNHDIKRSMKFENRKQSEHAERKMKDLNIKIIHLDKLLQNKERELEDLRNSVDNIHRKDRTDLKISKKVMNTNQKNMKILQSFERELKLKDKKIYVLEKQCKRLKDKLPMKSDSQDHYETYESTRALTDRTGLDMYSTIDNSVRNETMEKEIHNLKHVLQIRENLIAQLNKENQMLLIKNHEQGIKEEEMGTKFSVEDREVLQRQIDEHKHQTMLNQQKIGDLITKLNSPPMKSYKGELVSPRSRANALHTSASSKDARTNELNIQIGQNTYNLSAEGARFILARLCELMSITVPFELIEGVEKLLEVIKRTDSMKRYIEDVSELVLGKSSNRVGEIIDVNKVLFQLNQWKADISRIGKSEQFRMDIAYFLFDSDKDIRTDREILEKINTLKKTGNFGIRNALAEHKSSPNRSSDKTPLENDLEEVMKLLDVNRNTTEFIAKVKDNYFFGKAMEKFIAHAEELLDLEEGKSVGSVVAKIISILEKEQRNQTSSHYHSVSPPKTQLEKHIVNQLRLLLNTKDPSNILPIVEKYIYAI